MEFIIKLTFKPLSKSGTMTFSRFQGSLGNHSKICLLMTAIMKKTVIEIIKQLMAAVLFSDEANSFLRL